MRASLLATLLLYTSALSAQRATLRVPEFEQPITISLGDSAPSGDGFNSVTIHAGGHATTFHPRNPIACAAPNKEDRKRDISWAGVEGMRLDGSLCFYVGQFGANGSKHTILLFVSEGGASDAAPVLVIGFHVDGVPYKLLERDELDVASFINRPDGSALLIGKPTLSQVIAPLGYDPRRDPYATTYDPFAVYIITPDKPATYSLAESRSYNVKHYVWAGPKSSESYSVLYNIPGHSEPFVASAREANEILGGAEKERKQ